MPVSFCERASSLGIILSAWGVIQLSVIGLCLHLRSPAFVEDILIKEDPEQDQGDALNLRLGHQIDLGFARGALNCWVAALLYAVTFCLSLLGRWSQQRTKEVASEQLLNF